MKNLISMICSPTLPLASINFLENFVGGESQTNAPKKGENLYFLEGIKNLISIVRWVSSRVSILRTTDF